MPTPPPRERKEASKRDRNQGRGNPPANQADGTSNTTSDIAYLWLCIRLQQNQTSQCLPALGINATLVLLQ
eukprot:8470103-Ditylum_brightwellii.AAC.1